MSGYKGTWGDIPRQEAEKAVERRTRVLAHPDLAARLCEPPMKYPQPGMWTGYIPSATVPTQHGWRTNTSPIRRQLVEIVDAVAKRERLTGAPS